MTPEEALAAQKALKHMNHELHRSVIVIQHKNLVHRRLLRLWPCFDNDPGLLIVVVVGKSFAEKMWRRHSES